MMEVKAKDFIFCDDIRIEEGKKFSVMGIYTDKIRIIPKVQNIQKYRVPISAFIRFQLLDIKSIGDYRFSITVAFENVELAKIEGQINFGTETISSLPLTRIGLEVEKSGPLSFHVVMKSKENRVVLDHTEVLNVVIESVNPSGMA